MVNPGLAAAAAQGGDPGLATADSQKGKGRWPQGGIAAAAATILRTEGRSMTLEELGQALSRQRALPEAWPERLRHALAEHIAVCRVGTRTYDLTERRLAGAAFRHTLTEAECRYGLLLAVPDLDKLLRWRVLFPPSGSGPDCRDGSGQALPISLTERLGPAPQDPSAERTGRHEDRVWRCVAGLAKWLAAQGARAGDEVVFTALPPDANRFEVRLEAAAGAQAEPVRAVDRRFTEAALTVLAAAHRVLLPGELLRRVAGLVDLRQGAAGHLPVFVLCRDERFAFDGVFYGLREAVEEMAGYALASPHPRPEDYPQDWLERTTRGELGLQADAGAPAATGTPARRPARHTEIWEILQDRARLLNPAREPARWPPNVIRGPWLG